MKNRPVIYQDENDPFNFLTETEIAFLHMGDEKLKRMLTNRAKMFQVMYSSFKEYQPKENIRWNTVLFGLIGSRNALGFLSYANRNDDLRERDLIKDQYKNFGMESRYPLSWKY